MAFHSTLETSGYHPGALRSVVLYFWAAIKTSEPPSCNILTPFEISDSLSEGLNAWLFKAKIRRGWSAVAMQCVHYDILQHEITLQRTRHFF